MRITYLWAAGIMLFMLHGATAAAPEDGAPVKREIIPGSELMTSQERERYRQRMRSAKTPEAQQQVREEHLRQVRERARLRGLRLPEDANKK
ncbi:MAG TPA: hypothetical protein VLT92_17090 [Burkholderiales bacterium]|nr:hypothetical protein [Burkholderiales bacterium]